MLKLTYMTYVAMSSPLKTLILEQLIAPKYLYLNTNSHLDSMP